MHKDEKWQLFGENGEPIAGAWRSAELNNPREDETDIVGGAIVHLYRKNAEGEIELLWQQRSEQLDNFPGKWDVSAGGHVNLGESFAAAAVREAHEEIGAEIGSDDLVLIGLRRRKGLINFIYLVDWNGREDNFRFDDGEVAAVKWVPLAETDEFRRKFAKKPVAEDEGTYLSIARWFENGHGNI